MTASGWCQLASAIAKPVLAAIDELVRRVASTPIDLDTDMAGEAVGCGPNDATADRAQGDRNAPADASCERSVAAGSTESGQDAPADASDRRSVTELVAPGDIGCDGAGTRTRALDELRRRWQPMTDFGAIPTLAQQRADAFAALFLGLGVDLVTEIVIHVRGDGVTFDDGTPTTSSAVVRQLDGAFIRLMIHDTERRPINASNRRRFPTPAQRRVAMEMHGHECVDCQSTDLLELDHNPPFHQTGHTITDELEPRCAPCHRARHRYDHLSKSRAA